MALDSGSTIIIKKIKKGGHGHHGGAWKVAYADFVTAMMAFFLLLWLINVTTMEQKEGIADYFTPTFGIKDEAGVGTEGGKTPTDDGSQKQDLVPPGMIPGQTQQGPVPQEPKKDAPVENTADSTLFETAAAQIKKTFEDDPTFRVYRDNIIVEQNPEGLKIQVIDSDKYSMYEPDSVNLSPFGQQVLAKMSEIIMKMPNRISVTGHTDATNYAKSDAYTNWELSTDRANAARRFLLTRNVEPGRVMKVVGVADQDLLLPDQPSSPRNRRVTIILLRNAYLQLRDDVQPAPRGLLSVPRPTDNLNPRTPDMPVAPTAPGNDAKPAEAKPEATAPAPAPKPTPVAPRPVAKPAAASSEPTPVESLNRTGIRSLPGMGSPEE